MIQEKKYTEAINCCQEAIDIFKQHLEPSHPVILQTQLKVMSVFVEQGDIDSADKKFDEIIIQQQNLNDPQAVTTVALFVQQRASVNFEFGFYEKAQKLYEECIPLIGENPLVKHIKNELSCLFRTIGKDEKADELLHDVRTDLEKVSTSPSSISKFFQVMNVHQFTVTYTEKVDNKKPWPIWATYKIVLQVKRNPKDKTPRLKPGNIITLTLTNYDDPNEILIDEHADSSCSRIVVTQDMLTSDTVEERRAKLIIDGLKPAEGVYLAVVKIFENEDMEKAGQTVECGEMKQLSVSRINTKDITVEQLKDLQNKQRRVKENFDF